MTSLNSPLSDPYDLNTYTSVNARRTGNPAEELNVFVEVDKPLNSGSQNKQQYLGRETHIRNTLMVAIAS